MGVRFRQNCPFNILQSVINFMYHELILCTSVINFVYVLN